MDHDAEKAAGSPEPLRDDVALGSTSSHPKEPWSRRFIDSFKRDPNAHVTKDSERTVTKGGFDHEAAARATANSGLARKLKSRHMQMIAIGGSIGAFSLTCCKLVTDTCRNRSLRHIWRSALEWRSGFPYHRLRYHRHHDVLHRASPW